MSNNSLVRTQLEKTLTVKSLRDLARVKDTENVSLLLDCSGSMDERMRNGQRRIDGLREVVSTVQSKRTTQMIMFGPHQAKAVHILEQMSSPVVFFADEIPEPGGMTPLAEAIDFARTAGAGRLLLISDGGPNNEHLAMEAARNFGGRIDVCFVGDAGDPGSIFLEELARLTGGSQFEGDLSDPKALAGSVMGLLTGEVEIVSDDDDDDSDDDDDDEDDDDEI